jgi:hypothetical protein
MDTNEPNGQAEDFAERGWGEAQPQHALMPLRLVLGTQPRSDLVAAKPL